MKLENSRELWYDEASRTAVTLVDVASAAQALARGHLAGPVASRCLADALATAALLGGEADLKDESLSIQMKCTGPLGGYNVECTADGKLRGYTEKKLLEDFDGMGKADDLAVIGSASIQVTRSVPGRILAQGIAPDAAAYLRDSLQRKAVLFVESAVSDEVEVLEARGAMVETMPDGDVSKLPPQDLKLSLAAASRTILKRLGFPNAVLKKTSPLEFGCRCDPKRAASMLAALGEEERKTLPDTIDITCHMCGRTFSVRNR